jgi:hypothetical protein
MYVQLLENFLVFYVALKFIAVFIRAWSLS